jgi:transcriptional regulator with XRE-family HTH domain
MKRHAPQTLRAFRKAAGLTVSGVARKVGLHRSIISRIDRGERQPSIDTAAAIEEGLGLRRGALKFPKPRKADHGVAA